MSSRLYPLLLLLPAAGCTATPGNHRWAPTLAVDHTVVDDYELDVDAGVLEGTSDIDYTVTQVELGATRVEETADHPRKIDFLGVRVGFGDVEDDGIDSDLLELSAGGRWYFGQSQSIQPFFSLWSVVSDLDDEIGDDPQFGVRVGGGAELPISDTLALRGEVDYLIPVIPGEDELGLAEFEGSGLALRLGVSLTF
jgi:hypothetical protein